MTLSLDDVRNKRFRMARKSGYEVLEVDEFVDEVEETFGQLVEENTNLKKQIDALKSDASRQDESSSAPVPAPEPTPAPAPVAEPAPAPVPVAAARPGNAETIVVTTSSEASTAVVRLVQLSTEQSEKLVAEAHEEAGRIRDEANRNAHQLTTDARTRAERVESEARVNAERLQADAVGRAEKLERELESKRSEMFGDLEHQRDSLTQTVSALREFESGYRNSLTTHLKNQIDSLDGVKLEPAGGPERRPVESNGSAPSNGAAPVSEDSTTTMAGGSSQSDTPRLDALLGEQR